MILYRPVGLQELVLIYDSGMKAPCLRARAVLSLIPVSDTVKTFSFFTSRGVAKLAHTHLSEDRQGQYKTAASFLCQVRIQTTASL